MAYVLGTCLCYVLHKVCMGVQKHVHNNLIRISCWLVVFFIVDA